MFGSLSSTMTASGTVISPFPHVWSAGRCCPTIGIFPPEDRKPFQLPPHLAEDPDQQPKGNGGSSEIPAPEVVSELVPIAADQVPDGLIATPTNVQLESLYELEEWRVTPGDAPPIDLTTFGLPDDLGAAVATSDRPNWWLRLAGIAVVLGAVGLLFRRYATGLAS